MSARIDLTGKRIGAWTVVEFGGANKLGQSVWRCKCDCGVERTVNAQTLRTGKSKSCGCQKPISIARKLTPAIPTARSGQTQNWTPEYRAWMSMHRRCSARNAAMKRSYYERGIRVCDRWADYQMFLQDMGPIPHPGYTLDRINNDGIYEPENCRWADCATQSQNRRPHERWGT